jgi:hypothetical protein
MKKRIQKLTLNRETLRRMEDRGMEAVAGDGGPFGRTLDSICQCPTELCVSAGFTGCVTCNS